MRVPVGLCACICERALLRVHVSPCYSVLLSPFTRFRVSVWLRARVRERLSVNSARA